MVTPMNDQPGGRDRDGESSASADAPVRVLVVDDDEVIRQLITLNLELEGFEVHEAVDGADALRKVAEVRPAVVTLDVMMPNLDGWDAAARLRSDPETARREGRAAVGPGAGGGRPARHPARGRRLPDEAVRP